MQTLTHEEHFQIWEFISKDPLCAANLLSTSQKALKFLYTERQHNPKATIQAPFDPPIIVKAEQQSKECSFGDRIMCGICLSIDPLGHVV